MSANPNLLPVSEAAREAAEQAVSVANIVSHDGYYEVDVDAVAQVVAAFEQSKDAAFVAMLEGMKRDADPRAPGAVKTFFGARNAIIDEAIANARALGEGRAG